MNGSALVNSIVESFCKHKMEDKHHAIKDERTSASLVTNTWSAGQKEKHHGQGSNLRPPSLSGPRLDERMRTCPNVTRYATTTPPRLTACKGQEIFSI